jgi:HK97 family phage major capsid protein
MTASVALMGMPTTKVVTAGGNALDFPKVNAHGIGTQVIAQGTAIGGTDPTFAKMTLDAFKYGQLLKLSSEVIQDSGVDILGFVAGNIARAVGEVVATDLAVGSGSGEPNGVMTSVTGAGTIATGGSLIDPTYEKLIDLVYSVNGNYRARPSTAWLTRDLTAAALRKLRDGAGGTEGAPLWQPSVTHGLTHAEPDLLLGYPVYTDPNVASLASNAKVIAFGDFSAYYIRIASGFTLERSDDFAFDTDLVTFRGKTRVDGDNIDANAINVIKRSV